MSITQNVSKNNFYFLNLALLVQSIRMSLSRLHFYELGTFMICSFGTVLLLGDHKLSKIMSVVKGSLLTF